MINKLYFLSSNTEFTNCSYKKGDMLPNTKKYTFKKDILTKLFLMSDMYDSIFLNMVRRKLLEILDNISCPHFCTINSILILEQMPIIIAMFQ